ncbi:DUF5627 domain-containing protein [Geofilum rubicundum]|uniref:DUF1735 domain-containing protein n=1 Tax=Geofilum rubicundum JCM 15548 TaxID=1236989 RepID=A0A0E9LU77_9BACT|nr:DUF5627 domain-containing protein [Geofilum rubicundum]GAO28858.1 hypothetical protein JCM15548_1993 [Geofilum rubicundum JCM 15548]
MKKILFIFFITALVGSSFTSCENGDWDFPDFEYSTVYFAYQSPIRTVVLGEDVYDTTLDNERKVQIMATMGGVYANNTSVEIDISVEPSLLDDLVFDEDSDPARSVLLMPEDYYTLLSNKIVIPQGSVIGGVTVQLTEAFFNDPLALSTNYVIPVLMTGVTNADSILSGVPLVDNPKRGVASDWDVQPKDYILYAVKYINAYDANYLRRGTDEITIDGGTTTTVTRQADYVERDEVVKLNTISLNSVEFPMDYVSKDGHDLRFRLNLSVDGSQNVTVSAFETTYQVNDSVVVRNISVSGDGEFVKDGDKNSWGNQDRDAFFLDYEASYEVEIKYPVSGQPDSVHEYTYKTTDILVVRDRGVEPEWFTAVVNE